MPTTHPTLSFEHIRDYAERWTWLDPKTGQHETGYNAPPHAVEVHHLPFSFKALTTDGELITGRAICTEVNTYRHTRRIMFTEDDPKGGHQKGDFRWLTDSLIVEIDGVRFVAH